MACATLIVGCAAASGSDDSGDPAANGSGGAQSDAVDAGRHALGEVGVGEPDLSATGGGNGDASQIGSAGADAGPADLTDGANLGGGPAPPGDASTATPDAARPPAVCGEGVSVIDLNVALLGQNHFDGDLTAASSDGLAESCGGAAGGEFVFRYRVDHPLERLTFSTEHPETVHPAVLSVRMPTCALDAEVACDRGSLEVPGRHITLQGPTVGELYLIVDTGAREGSGVFRLSVDAVEIPQCRDSQDNDQDALIDAADPGCTEGDDPTEVQAGPPALCSDGLDNDGDGAADHPADPDCVFAGGDREAPLCAPGTAIIVVADGQGVVELPPLEGMGGATASCDLAFGPEHVLQLHLAEPSHVTLEVFENGAAWATALSARSECAEPESELACVPQATLRALRLEQLPAGTVYLFIEAGFVPAAGPREAHLTIVSAVTECNDGVDQDFDGDVDLNDAGCEGPGDDSEGEDAGAECGDGADNDGDGLSDFPGDPGCAGRGDAHEGGCEGDPLWQPVECQIGSWVWSANNAFQDVASANANRVLYSGCMHDGVNPAGLCSLDGTGWVSVDTFPMVGCDQSWFHLGGQHTGQCGGHDGDTVRHLVLGEDDCWDYR